MTLKVIELNDSAIKVSDESGLILQSPGFALVGDRGLEVGEEAEKQARLRPTSSFNKFWHRLSMEPLSYSVTNVRHFADLAFAHLLHVAEKAELEGDVILAVPGNFTSQQLSILLGLAGQCPFNPVGIVDSALVAAIKIAETPSVVYADIQLHQALLTKFSISDGNLQRESVIQIPEVGLQNFMDLTMQLATGLFIQQCRFNPQHNAESEQQLYNALPDWLSQSTQAQSSLMMEIKTASAIHQAKFPLDQLVQKLEGFYNKINKQIAALSGDSNGQVLISSGLSALPNFTNTIQSSNDIQVVTPDTLGRSCIDFRQFIESSGEGIHFVTKLPLGEVGSAASKSVESKIPEELMPDVDAAPTHVLFESYALPLGRVAINNETGSAKPTVNGSSIQLALSDMPEFLGQIEKEQGQIYLVCGEAGALVNGEKVLGKTALSLGDCIKFSKDSDAFSLIRVQDGNS